MSDIAAGLPKTAIDAGADIAHRPSCCCSVIRKTSRADRGETLTRHGYNLRHWEEGDLGFWAVTDASPTELAEFERLFRAATKV